MVQKLEQQQWYHHTVEGVEYHAGVSHEQVGVARIGSAGRALGAHDVGRCIQCVAVKLLVLGAVEREDAALRQCAERDRVERRGGIGGVVIATCVIQLTSFKIKFGSFHEEKYRCREDSVR